MFLFPNKHKKEQDSLKNDIAKVSAEIQGHFKEKNEMIEIIRDSALIADTNGKILVASEKLTNILGYQTLIGKKLKTIIPNISKEEGDYVFRGKTIEISLHCKPLFRDDAIYCKVLL